MKRIKPDEDGTLLLRGRIDIEEYDENKGLIKKIIIGKSIEKIPNRAFFGCSNLESVIFEEPSQVTTLEYFCFKDCVKLTTIDLPSSIQEIDHLAFGECPLETIILRGSCFLDMACFMTNLLTYLHIADSIQKLDKHAFYGFSYYYFSKTPCKIYIREEFHEDIKRMFQGRDIEFIGNELDNGYVLK